MGIDCGGEYTGFGVVENPTPNSLKALTQGVIKLSPREPLELRLARIYDTLSQTMRNFEPEVVAIEDVFFAANAKSALKLGHIRGAAMLAAAHAKLPVAAYAPLSVKSAVVGYGKAEKAQVQVMVTRLLKLPAVPDPPDIADALAIAICHINTSQTLVTQREGDDEAKRALIFNGRSFRRR